MDVSIIIVNYNTAALTVAAIESVFDKTTGLTYEIIVVDNNSADHSKELFERQLGKKISCLWLEENLGFGRANNEGICAAKGRNVLFLNPDTLLRNNAIKTLSDYLDSHPKVGVVGGNLYDGNGCPTSSHNQVMPSIFDEIDQALSRKLSHLIYGRNTLFNYSHQPINVGFVVGADMMTRYEILQKVGGFDPDFFMYYEETELTYRIKRAGYKVVNVPMAEITHLEGGSFSQSRPRELRSLTSRKVYFAKTHKRWYAKLADVNYLCITKFSLFVSQMIGLKSYTKKLHQRIGVIKEVERDAQKN